MEGVEPPAAHVVIDLRPYLRPDAAGPALYARRNLAEPDEPAQLYERRSRAGTLTEGALAAKRIRTVAEYLEPTARAAYRRGALWPEDPQRRGTAFFLEFDPPLAYLPASIDAQAELTQRCRLRYFNRDAEPVREGTVTRKVAFEGYEAVEAGGIEYPGCLRMRVDTRYRLNWGPRVDTTEYIWLARGVGEVRRLERVSGLALFVYFSGVYAYELIETPLPSTRLARGQHPRARAWVRCAVFLDRVLPHPRLGGVAIELAPAADADTVAATAEPNPGQARPAM